MSEILTLEGHRAPPSSFVRKLEKFDPNLRVVWGLGQTSPFPGWVIERRIPGHMKEKVYGGNKAANRERFADQYIVDANGSRIGRRQYDMMPDWHPVYCVMDGEGQPITELGEFVIEYLRQPNVYRRTLLGFPELSMKFMNEDRAEHQAAQDKKHDQLITEAAEQVVDRRTEVWPEHFGHSGQPNKVMEGTEL